MSVVTAIEALLLKGITVNADEIPQAGRVTSAIINFYEKDGNCDIPKRPPVVASKVSLARIFPYSDDLKRRSSAERY